MLPYMLIAGSISHAIVLARAPVSGSSSCDMAGTVLQNCLNSLNVRKPSLAVRERKSQRERGYESMTAGTDFAYAVEASNRNW
jgi:hypothetical protein